MTSVYVYYYVAFACLAFVVDMSVAVYSDLQYLTEWDEATRPHWNDVAFLKKVMEVDYLWSPILNEMVKIEVPRVLYYDRYASPDDQEDPDHLNDLEDQAHQAARVDSSAPENPDNIVKIVLPLKLITNLMATKTFSGSEVRTVMTALKSAITCSVLKYVSLQGTIHHNLMKTEYLSKSEDDVMFHNWLVNMVQMAMDKLTAMDDSQDPNLPITRTRDLLAEMRRKLSENNDPNYTTRSLDNISLEMFNEIEKTCVVPRGEDGHYSALVADFNNDSRVKELMAHRTQLTESLKEATDIKSKAAMHENNGDIPIEKNITLENIGTLDADALKRATAANHIQMALLYLNLPIRILAKSQWAIISQGKVSTDI